MIDPTTHKIVTSINIFYVLTIFLLQFSFSGCKTKRGDESIEVKRNNEFVIESNTTVLNLKNFISSKESVSLTHAVELNNKFYCFFEENIQYSQDKKLFVSFSDDGRISGCISAPEGIQNSVYYDLFIRNDSIISKAYMGEYETYYFDIKTKRWKQIQIADDVIYENNDYRITFIDYGEWGFTTWFQDKKTHKEYELASKGLIVNKVNNAYYITDEYQILKIENPCNLRPCDLNYYYSVAKMENNFYERSNYKLDGAKIIYKDTTNSGWYWEEPGKFRVISSFINNKKLYHLCVDSNKTYIARLNRGNFIPVVELKNFKNIFFRPYYAFRYNNQPDKRQLLTFSSYDYKTYGLFLIKNNIIEIKHIRITNNNSIY